MTREEVLAVAKPILFNTEMVMATLKDKKTDTRRIAKNITQFDDEGNYFNMFRKGEWTGPITKELLIELYAPYKIGDYLYVRETWCVQRAKRFDSEVRIMYKDGGSMTTIYFPNVQSQSIDRVAFDSFVNKWWNDWKWHPSIHMPKEASRLFLRVTDVRVERIQNITEQGAELEGCSSGCVEITGGPWGIEDDPDVWTAKDKFIEVWDSTIRKKDLDKYGWAANPLVWVVSFEKMEVDG